MSTAGVLVALLVAAAVAGLVPPRRRWADAPGDRPTTSDGDPRWRRLLVAGGCGVAAWAFLGGAVGALGGAVAAVVAHRALGRVESPAAVRRREQVARDLPTAVDLLAACLDAGEPPARALRTVADALPGPVAGELRALRHRLDLGVDPTVVWAELSGHAQLGPLGRALGRAHESGASVREAVHQLAEELREGARGEVEERARALEVKVSAPLGLCLLPAFVVLGIVPLVVGLVASLAPR